MKNNQRGQFKKNLILRLLIQIISLYQKLCSKIESRLPIITILAFILGILLARYFSLASGVINSSLTKLINSYTYFAPIAIFGILAPSLARIINIKRGGAKKFVRYALIWLSLRRLLSLFWAAIFTVIIFDFPIFSNHSVRFLASVQKSLTTLAGMALKSPYFYAMYAAIGVVLLSTKISWIERILRKCARAIEALGRLLIPFIPLFMLSIGTYLYSLPRSLNEQLGVNGVIATQLRPLNVLGCKIASNTALGMIIIYLVISAIIGIACFIWHSALLSWTKKAVNSFSISKYFRKYWIKVYPLLWATSSEALATPLNLYLVKKYYPQIKTEVRRFIIGIGSYMNINGTMICVIVLAGAVAQILGIELSLVKLMLCIPLVFIIGFGVPGIPGELLLFAGPLVMLLDIPQSLQQSFLTLYLGLQIGLPDSFRTGNNSTDDCVCGILMNKTYERRFLSKYKEEEDE
ncbi:MAG: cation:dicarboxylase symporter family transporter [Candidatus Omnitrophota bacterium]